MKFSICRLLLSMPVKPGRIRPNTVGSMSSVGGTLLNHPGSQLSYTPIFSFLYPFQKFVFRTGQAVFYQMALRLSTPFLIFSKFFSEARRGEKWGRFPGLVRSARPGPGWACNFSRCVQSLRRRAAAPQNARDRMPLPRQSETKVCFIASGRAAVCAGNGHIKECVRNQDATHVILNNAR